MIYWLPSVTAGLPSIQFLLSPELHKELDELMTTERMKIASLKSSSLPVKHRDIIIRGFVKASRGCRAVIKCCSPVPGDPIISFVTEAEGFPSTGRIVLMCALMKTWTDWLMWNGLRHVQSFEVNMEISAYDRTGMIWYCGCFGRDKISITSINAKVSGNKECNHSLGISIRTWP